MLLMPGLALLTAQFSFVSIVPTYAPVSIVDHVLLHVLQVGAAANNRQSSDDMQLRPRLLLSHVPCCKACRCEQCRLRQRGRWHTCTTA